MSESKVVLVTGSSSGFGDFIVKTMAKAGYHVYASMRGVKTRNAAAVEALESWAADENASLKVIEMDVADDGSVQMAVDEVLAEAGQIDVVVNNAGIAAGGPLEAFDIQQMQELYDINVWGPIRVDKAVLPQMRSRRSGLLIHVTSTLGRVLPRSGGLYPASKWAAEGLAESLHYQLKPFDVDVVILEPGTFPTSAISKGMRPNDEMVVEEYAAMPQTARRAVEPSPDYKYPDVQEVADAVLRIVETPAGQRPLRDVVGPIFTLGVEEYNRRYEEVRDALAESLTRPDQAIPWARG